MEEIELKDFFKNTIKNYRKRIDIIPNDVLKRYLEFHQLLFDKNNTQIYLIKVKYVQLVFNPDNTKTNETVEFWIFKVKSDISKDDLYIEIDEVNLQNQIEMLDNLELSQKI